TSAFDPLMIRPLSTFLVLSVLAGEPEPLGFDVLAGFDYTEGMTLPKEVSSWDEKEVKVRGFMRREFPGDGPVNSFMLINDNCGCTGTPKLNEIVFCMLPEGETEDVHEGIVTVTGKLYIGEEKEDGYVIMIYQMDADQVTTSQ
ncbi:MAG: hypothetical protein VYD05_11775, partial [Planctomycetota bacterium]|nr:hypothetical protein [Planctomycetota bacterium]